MSEHRIFPHGLPEQVADNLWQVRGSLPFPLPRNMTIVRLPNGGLLLHSVVAMEEAGMRALEGLGAPRIMVIPHSDHTMDAQFYARRYPNLQILAPAVVQDKLGERVTITAEPDKVLPGLGISCHPVPGLRTTEIVFGLTVEQKTALLFTDMFAQTPPGARLMMRLLGPPGGRGVPRIVKFRQVRDRAALRTFMRGLADIPNVGLLLCGHAPPIKDDCNGALRAAAAAI